MTLNQLIEQVYDTLLLDLHIESINPVNPVVVHHVPTPWQTVGTGNYAAVFVHPHFQTYVIKVYAPGRPGFSEEVEVYQRLGSHPAFSECFHAGQEVLIFKRLKGVTLYDCVHQGIKIPPQVIRDIDAALSYARSIGLNPHDVHGKNVMMLQGQGVVVDVSDFLKPGYCCVWSDLKKAYYWIYLPVISRLPGSIPYPLLDLIRVAYRKYRKICQRRPLLRTVLFLV